MSWYKFWQGIQPNGYPTSWFSYLEEEEDKVLASNPNACFISVLSINTDNPDTVDAPRYRGPLYFDWDAKQSDDPEQRDRNIGYMLEEVREFMHLMQSQFAFDLNQARWFLSGGKGVHCEIPMACAFGSKSDLQNGIELLPIIYKSFATSLEQEDLDTKIYSCGKGRLWRLPNVRREKNGKVTYKVQISPDRLRELTPEAYWEYCAETKPLFAPSAPTLNTGLQDRFTVHRSEIADAYRNKRKENFDTSVFKDWEQMPQTLEAAFNGDAINMKSGLNDIAMQLASAALALGDRFCKDVDDFLKLCEGFIEKRLSSKEVQSCAHRTAASIRKVLRSKYNYFENNPAYAYSPRALEQVLLPPRIGESRADLRGVQVASRVDLQQVGDDLKNGLVADEIAVRKSAGKDDESLVAVVDYSWVPGSVSTVRDESGLITHYIAQEVFNGEVSERRAIPLKVLQDAREFSRYLGQRGCTLGPQAARNMGALLKTLTTYAANKTEDTRLPVVQLVRHEGMEIKLLNPTKKGNYEAEVYWVQPDKVYSSTLNPIGATAPIYMNESNPSGYFGMDVASAPDMTDPEAKERCEKVLHHMLQLNGDTYTLAMLLGWFTGCMIKQQLYVTKRTKNYPVLQIAGPAGCGKTTTANLLLHLFTSQKDLKVKSAGEGLTDFALGQMLAGTTTTPIVIDELKRGNVSKEIYAKIVQKVQVSYTTGSESVRGGGNTTTSNFDGINRQYWFAPMCILVETPEIQQASMEERSVIATFAKRHTLPRREHSKYLNRNETDIGILGWALIKGIVDSPISKFTELYDQTMRDVDESFGVTNNERVKENAISVLTGYRVFKRTVQEHFPGQFDERLTALEDALLDGDRWSRNVRSEIEIFMQHLADASFNQYGIACTLNYHYQYVDRVVNGDRKRLLVLQLPRCLQLYSERCRQAGVEPHYASVGSLEATFKETDFVYDIINSTSLGGRSVEIDVDKLIEEGLPTLRE